MKNEKDDVNALDIILQQLLWQQLFSASNVLKEIYYCKVCENCHSARIQKVSTMGILEMHISAINITIRKDKKRTEKKIN
jgi:hypothetical protein